MCCARKMTSFFVSANDSLRLPFFACLPFIDPGEQQPVYYLFALNAVFPIGAPRDSFAPHRRFFRACIYNPKMNGLPLEFPKFN
jgi:hypothetical protein